VETLFAVHNGDKLWLFFWTDSGHYTMRDVVYDEYTDEETSDGTSMKPNRYVTTRHITSPTRSTGGSQVLASCSSCFTFSDDLKFRICFDIY